MFRIFGDIPRCLNQRDDILLGGRDDAEHYDKVKAIQECRAPEDKEAVLSFLGMAGYLDNFIENYATIAAPLYQLIRRETKFQWGKEEEVSQ